MFSVCMRAKKRREKRRERSERESQLDLGIFPHFIYLFITILPYGKRVHLHGNSSRRSPWKGDAYKSTTPFHARKKIKVFIPGHKLWLKTEKENEKKRERQKLSYLDNKYVRVFYSSFFPKIAYELLIIPPTLLTLSFVKFLLELKQTPLSVRLTHEAFQHYYILTRKSMDRFA